jgi:hypothetical protein
MLPTAARMASASTASVAKMRETYMEHLQEEDARLGEVDADAIL